jgi:adenylate kinase family enzyme
VNPDISTTNAQCIEREIIWFREILERRLKLHAGEEAGNPIDEIPPPELPDDASSYADVVRQFEMEAVERLVLILSYIPHVKPDVLDSFFIQNHSVQRRFTEFGGLTGLSHIGFLPTGETAMFLLAGNDIQVRLRFHDLFSHEHYFYTHQILRLNHRHQEEPPLSSALHLTPEYVELLTTGRSYHPPFSPEFPAQLLTTPYEWSDLVLDLQTRHEIEDIAAWVQHQDMLMDDWLLRKRLKPGFRTLFYGPPGTGKTLTASLLGKATGLSVYRIDLSKVVSKYIGETEKNLASLFDYAQHQNWILFFDEADSLFGKRTESRNANDRAANQQISYLLQRIEDFPGVVILATNLRSHLDEAFARRFQSMVHFPMPSVEQRRRLWDDNFKDKPYRLAQDIDLHKLAHDYELSGGSIINVLRYACLKAVVRTPQEIRAQDLHYGIRKELHKEGKFLK